MLKIERREKIKSYLLVNKFANIKELAESMDVSTATIRRTLKELEDDGTVEMSHGGVALKKTGILYEQPYSVRRLSNLDEKQRIAQEAVKHIDFEACAYLDSSATVFQMTKYLKDLSSVIVVTNDIAIANALSDIETIDVSVIGGSLRKHYFTLTGFFSETIMKDLFFDIAFMGFDAISMKNGCMITNIEEVQIKRMAIKAAHKAVVMCDHSKFTKEAFINVCGLEDIDLIITGKELDKQIYAQIVDAGVDIILV